MLLTIIGRVVYPLDTVKTRLQALPPSTLEPPENEDDKLSLRKVRKDPLALPIILARRLRRWQMLSLLIRIMRTEGLTGAFKGFSANMINTFSMREPHSRLP